MWAKVSCKTVAGIPYGMPALFKSVCLLATATTAVVVATTIVITIAANNKDDNQKNYP